MKITDIKQVIQEGGWCCSYSFIDLVRTIERMKEGKGFSKPLEMQPDFQRANVWSEEQEIAYVETVLKGGATHARTIYLNCPDWKGGCSTKYKDFVCVDGLQRYTAIKKFGGLDILINNAGITGTPAPVHEMSEEMFRNVLDCNIMIAFHCSHYGIQEMIKQNKGGAIVNVSSVAGLTGFPGHSAYVTSKHGLNGLTRNMALDYARYGIRVNAVNPGTTDTPMYHEALEFLKNKRESAEKAGVKIEGGIVSGKVTSPQNRVARAEEVADVILFLSSPEASNVTGIFMPVDGGFTAF